MTNLSVRSRSRAPALRPLCALIMALPFVAIAQGNVDNTLQSVTVRAEKPALALGASRVDAEAIQATRSASSDSASLLRSLPGFSVQGAGGVSGLPSVHGMTDDRLRIQVDGMDLLSACGNHMNPPLSYIDPSRVASVRVFAGAVPVSVGGDSIGATVQVEAAAPEFAPPGAGTLLKGEAGTFYRSNGHGVGANLAATYATEQMSLRYDGAMAQSDNYRSAKNFKAAGPAANNKPTHWLGGDEVGSTSYHTRNHALGFALRGDAHLLELKLGVQDIPYQNYPNQRMDMTRNDSHHLNLRYQGQFDWGQLQARAYHEKTRHAMNFGADKQFWYGPKGDVPGMPMDTEGQTTGLSVKADVALSARDTLRVGTELQKYRLDDWWLPSGGGMAPNTFNNIHDGQRDRFDVFAEWEARWSAQWLSQIGLRSANVRSNSGAVQGYNASYDADANAFNARERQRTDHNWDFTALARFTPSDSASYEFGWAHKTRSPNLYERYSWSTGGMAMRMVNLAGDGNGYVGNLDLKPEVANTLSATANWHDASGKQWGIQATPYLTYVDNYIDAKRCGGGMGAMTACNNANLSGTDKFVYLRFANQDARLYGLDLSGFAELGRISGWGDLTASGVLSYVKGKNRTSGDNLYNTMPFNARFALTQRLGGWSSTAELQLVSAKKHVSAERNELTTAGYGLLHLRASYQWKQVRVDAGVDNVFNRFYNHPQGGAYVGQGQTMAGTAVPWGVRVPGMGRSLNLGVTMKF